MNSGDCCFLASFDEFLWFCVEFGIFCEFLYVLTIFLDSCWQVPVSQAELWLIANFNYKLILGWVACKLPVKASRLLQGDESRHLYQVLLQETPEILCKKYIWDIHKSIGMDSELGGRQYILTLVSSAGLGHSDDEDDEDDEEELVFDEDKH